MPVRNGRGFENGSLRMFFEKFLEMFRDRLGCALVRLRGCFPNVVRPGHLVGSGVHELNRRRLRAFRARAVEKQASSHNRARAFPFRVYRASKHKLSLFLVLSHDGGDVLFDDCGRDVGLESFLRRDVDPRGAPIVAAIRGATDWPCADKLPAANVEMANKTRASKANRPECVRPGENESIESSSSLIRI